MQRLLVGTVLLVLLLVYWQEIGWARYPALLLLLCVLLSALNPGRPPRRGRGEEVRPGDAGREHALRNGKH